jgi:hypothetical protein
MVQLDTMHVLDHHGIIALATGALLATALRGKEVAQTQPATLTYLNNHLRAFYRRNRVQHRVGNIRVSNIFNGKRAATTARRTGGGQEPASLEGGLCGRDNLTAGRAARGGEGGTRTPTAWLGHGLLRVGQDCLERNLAMVKPPPPVAAKRGRVCMWPGRLRPARRCSPPCAARDSRRPR